MVAKSKTVSKVVTTRNTLALRSAKSKTVSKVATKTVSKASPLKKIRIGIVVGKSFDPVKKGDVPPKFPKELCLTEDEWGKYSIDVCTAVRMKTLHPDLVDIDIIPGKELTQNRLKKNHVNVNFWYGVAMAGITNNKSHIEEVRKCHYNPECRLDPSLDFYDWIENKSRYMETLIDSGIPMIPTVIYKNGFTAKQCLEDVQKKGWEKFFCKVGHNALFGNGAINGKTADFLGERAKDLKEYEKLNKQSKVFLLQPYMLKPNGQVFDEVRNFYIDGEWRYSVFTHGTDMSNRGYYEEPEGPRKEACKALADRAFKEIMKKASYQGKTYTPLFNRIDIGVMPKQGANSLHKTDNTYFVNEVELIICTWLDRYATMSVQENMAHATIKHSLGLLAGMLKSKQHIPDEEHVRRAARMLNNRIGPFKHINV